MMSMYNYCDGTVHFKRRKCSTSPAVGVQLERYIQFSDTEKGADASAAVMSIIETAKRNKLDVYGYLTHLLTVLPEWG